MQTAGVLIALMGVGLLFGYVVPVGETVKQRVAQLTSVLVALLLFVLGFGLGINQELIAGLGTLGVQSFVIAVLAMGGSVGAAWAFAKILRISGSESARQRGGVGKALLGSAGYLFVFAVGVLVGIALGFKPRWMVRYDATTYLLYALMLAVGFSVGSDKASLAMIRHMTPRLLFLPAVTVLGTLLGATAAYVLLPGFTLAELNAIGAGYGYYSLSSVLIGETVEPASRGAMLGSVALMSNICREVFSILLAGPIARWFGPLAPVSSAGATSMDTTLPFVVRASGKEYAVVAVYHGVLLTILCPILVALFLRF